MNIAEAYQRLVESGKYAKYQVAINGDAFDELVLTKDMCERSGDDALHRITYAALKRGKLAWYGSANILVNGERLGEDGVSSVMDLYELHLAGATVVFDRPAD